MKKLLLLATFIASYCVSAQTPPPPPIYIQNYTPNYVEYNLIKSNLGSPTTGCTPNLEARTVTNNLLKLGYTNDPSVSIDANYDGNVNNTFAFNAAYPSTPQVGRWIANSNFAAPYYAPAGVLNVFSNVTTWTGIKFGVQDQSGVNVGGYYFLGQFCGSTTVYSDLTGNVIPPSMTDAVLFTVGGATWVVIF
ncbi:hypothetical protein [Chryseobacterium sp. G0201]|uniref:hypothetical protein n=1 Tax=Chryseobacterium sp. G0201 TaxID=2487065 RepID=UPI000F4FD66A|nr:hypothetical protein [Chryseobacterium sp. G0201]AZA52750.1 hypothetical protein EG348_06895 [Chryseobacterium sp. G0201]